MNENKKFNLYEEDDRKNANLSTEASGNLVSDSTIIYVDLTKPLPELIKPIREHLEDKPEGYSLGIYIICGYEFNSDISLFIDYLNTIKGSFNFQIYFRGIIHSDFIHLLFFENLFIESNSRLVYRTDQLHKLLKNLMSNPKIFRAFIQRFIDEYNKINSFQTLDLTELEQIGFQFQKF